MKILVLADQGARVDDLVADLERSGHNVVVAGGRAVAAAVLGSVGPAAMLAVSEDPVEARRFLVGLPGGEGLPVLALPADAGVDEVSLVVGALTGTLGPPRAPAPHGGPATLPPPLPQAALRRPPVTVGVRPAVGAHVAPAPPQTVTVEQPPAPRGSDGERADVTPAPRAPSASPDPGAATSTAPAPVGVAPPTPEPMERLPAVSGAARARELVDAALEHARRGTYFDLLGLDTGATAGAVRQRVDALAEVLRGGAQGAAPELRAAARELARALDDAWYVLGDDELRSRYAAAIARSESGAPSPRRT